MARAVFFVSVLALAFVGATLAYKSNAQNEDSWDEIDLSKLYHKDLVDPGFNQKPVLGGPGDPDNPNYTRGPIPGGKDDPDNPNYTRGPIFGGKDDPDNPHNHHHPDGGLEQVEIPADATAPFNCTTVEQLKKHHHHTCGPAFGYTTHHCHCDWGQCRESKRPHSYCGCPWGKCKQDRPKYCIFIWKYCAHHHHKPGIEPRNLQPVMSDDVITGVRAATTLAAPTTAEPTTAAPTTAVPTTAAPTTAAPTTAAPTTAAPTTAAPTTAAPTTAALTTAAPTTAAPTTAAPTTAAPTTAAPTHPTHRPSHRCGPWGYATFACVCPMGSCYSKHRPHGYCGCPWGYCKGKRPEFCRYFWKHCPQPHCGTHLPEPEKPVIDNAVEATTALIPSETPKQTDAPTPPPTKASCGKYGVASDKCKCSWYKCRFWPHRPSGECGCPWGFCREDRPRECKEETPNPHDLRPTDSPRPPRPTHGHHHHDKCGKFGVATKDCQCYPGNCRADRPSSECGCPWGLCDQRRPYHCKWRGTEDHHHHHHHGPDPTPDHHHSHHHHHHGPPPHHHHHHHHHHPFPPHPHHHSGSSSSSESSSSESGSSESGSSSGSSESGSSESSEEWQNRDKHQHKGRRYDEDLQADKMQMVLYGAMGFLICSLGFLFMATMVSMVMKRVRNGTGPVYRNLAATPVEFVRNPLEDLARKPEDKEKLMSHQSE